MAFYEWIDDSVTDKNILSATDFATNDERINGFQSGQAASSKNVNSALRQSTLVAKALMDVVDPNSQLNLGSSSDAVKNKIENYLANITDYATIRTETNTKVTDSTYGDYYRSSYIVKFTNGLMIQTIYCYIPEYGSTGKYHYGNIAFLEPFVQMSTSANYYSISMFGSASADDKQLNYITHNTGTSSSLTTTNLKYVAFYDSNSTYFNRIYCTIIGRWK